MRLTRAGLDESFRTARVASLSSLSVRSGLTPRRVPRPSPPEWQCAPCSLFDGRRPSSAPTSHDSGVWEAEEVVSRRTQWRSAGDSRSSTTAMLADLVRRA